MTSNVLNSISRNPETEPHDIGLTSFCSIYLLAANSVHDGESGGRDPALASESDGRTTNDLTPTWSDACSV